MRDFRELQELSSPKNRSFGNARSTLRHRSDDIVAKGYDEPSEFGEIGRVIGVGDVGKLNGEEQRLLARSCLSRHICGMAKSAFSRDEGHGVLPVKLAHLIVQRWMFCA